MRGKELETMNTGSPFEEFAPKGNKEIGSSLDNRFGRVGG